MNGRVSEEYTRLEKNERRMHLLEWNEVQLKYNTIQIIREREGKEESKLSHIQN